MRIALLIFAKAPVPGYAKTRLIPLLGAEGAAHLQQQLTTRMFESALQFNQLNQFNQSSLNPHNHRAVQLWCAPDTAHPFFQQCEQQYKQHNFYDLSLHIQQGEDLGAKMSHAIETVLQTHDAAILCGTDCPELSPNVLQQAAKSLEQHDAVFVPALDGGYVLVGMRHSEPEIFQKVAWGTDQVMAQTEQRLQESHLSWEKLPPLADLDTPDDWQKLPELLKRKLTSLC